MQVISVHQRILRRCGSLHLLGGLILHLIDDASIVWRAQYGCRGICSSVTSSRLAASKTLEKFYNILARGVPDGSSS